MKKVTFEELIKREAEFAAATAAPYDCEHQHTQIRARQIRGGSTQYVRQCQECGEPVGNPVKQTGQALPFEDELLENANAIRAQRREVARQAVLANRRAEYREYMSSEAWFDIRERVLKRDGYVCRGCLSEKATEVHHATYAHFTEEFAFELLSLCRGCHERFHADDE